MIITWLMQKHVPIDVPDPMRWEGVLASLDPIGFLAAHKVEAVKNFVTQSGHDMNKMIGFVIYNDWIL